MWSYDNHSVSVTHNPAKKLQVNANFDLQKLRKKGNKEYFANM
jgi:hypothetical protein